MFVLKVKSFLGEIEDVVNWLGEFEQTLKAVKTIGALPDTAQKQCEKFNVSIQSSVIRHLCILSYFVVSSVL